MKKNRIWELDAFRGLCLIGMVIVHGIYDVVELYGLIPWQYPPVFLAVKDWGGVLFLLLSGVCVTLGSRNLRRGALVFGAGQLVTLVTFAMERLGFVGSGFTIWFGVLHCLGLCMMVWSLFRALPGSVLTALGVGIVALGLVMGGITVDFPWLIPLGLCPATYSSADYFPLLPTLGFFLLGAAAGRRLYREKTTLFPKVNENSLPIRFLTGCGKLSLWIYLLHQVVLCAVLELITILMRM